MVSVKLQVFERAGAKRTISVAVKIDFDKSPKQIDFLDKGKTRSHGIFKLKGRTLTICLTDGKGERPKKFESTGGSRVQLLVFERAKME